MAYNQLEVIVKDSGLESTKAKFILEKFKHYFDLADEWTIKAKSIIVTRADQEAEMAMAKTGRLFLQKKRTAIETSRKELKEQALREGKAIDGIANVLKALIVPIEEYLEQQEKFVEIQEEKKREEIRLEIEARIAEEERVAAEKAATEQERIRLENEKLKAEAIEREKQAKLDRLKQEELLAKERAKAEAERKVVEEKARKEREAIELANKIEREKQAKILAEQKAKADEAKRIAEEKARKEKERAIAKLEAERKEKQRLEEILKNTIECPHCHKTFQLERK